MGRKILMLLSICVVASIIALPSFVLSIGTLSGENGKHLSVMSEEKYGGGDDLIFIHHSCGQNWLDDGLHDALLAKDYIDERNDIYYGTDLSSDAGRPDSLSPTPGDNTDMNHWILWFNDYLDNIKIHGCEDGTNRIIMFKSCFPNSNVGSDDSEPGDPFSSKRTLANYKAVYRHPDGLGNTYTHDGYVYKPLEDIFAENPDVLFIPVTAPPRHYAPSDATNDDEAHRARVFNNWLKNEWLADYDSRNPGLNNVAVFDWFDVLAYPDNHSVHPNRLKAKYGGESGNSHPNGEANSYSTQLFATNQDDFIDNAWSTFNSKNGNIYYVATSGDDSNSGTVDKPWRTIQKAADTMMAGDMVYIREGTYNEQISTVRSGDNVNGSIVFSSYPDERVVIDGADVESGNTGVSILHSYIEFVGLEICNWDDTGIWIAGAGHVGISDCEIHNTTFGIGAADGTHDFGVNRVEIHHFDLYGFDASPSGGDDCYNGIFNDCIIHTARDRSQNVDGFALGHGLQHNFVFNRCISYDVFDGFDISAGDTTLDRCSSNDCWNTGYKIWQDNVTMVNCLGYHNGITNVELDWDGQPGVVTLQNCNFVDSQVYNIWMENSADSLHMYNCILAGGDNIGLAFEQTGVGNYHGDYNVFHNDNPNRTIAVAYTDEFSTNEIADGDWTDYSGQDEHSLISVDPNSELFSSLGSWDFHLVNNSMAIDAGTPQNSPPVDYDGFFRPYGAGYDIGAYEYQGKEILEVDIIVPKEGYLYIVGREIIPLPSRNTTIILGEIIIEADTNGEWVEFYVDDAPRYEDDSRPYSWKWDERTFGIHDISVTSYSGEETAKDKIEVLVFNIR